VRGPQTARDASLDVTRGIAIIAIVLGHVLRGLNAAHLLGHGSWIAGTDTVLYLWHLCVFAFVGGVFVAKSVNRRGMRSYLWERETQLLVIYLLWTVIQGTVQLLASRAVNYPTSIVSVISLWAPTGQLWYLPFVMFVTLVFVPARPWLPHRAPWFLSLALVISLSLWGYGRPLVGTQGLGLVIFFVGGMVLGIERAQAVLKCVPVPAAAAFGVLLFAVGVFVAVTSGPTPPTEGWSSRTVSSVAIGFVLSVELSGAVLLFGWSARSWSFLALCGRRSLDIFLAHIILGSGSRIVLVKLGVQSIPVLVAVGLISGVIGSLILTTGLRRVGLAWLLDGPRWLTRTGTGGPANHGDTRLDEEPRPNTQVSNRPGSQKAAKRNNNRDDLATE
jgi:fucose 4-O-acetylase-like acetyltransferase